MKIFQAPVPGVPRAGSNPEETKRLLDFQSSIRPKANAPLILSYPRSGETPCELVMGHRAPTFGPFDFRFTVTVTAPSAKSRT